jgi:hypothetical protein
MSTNPRYQVGQKVIVKLPTGKSRGTRDSTLEPYAGQIGEVIDYYWISPRFGEVFYIYRVRMAVDNKEIILHEDEIKQ